MSHVRVYEITKLAVSIRKSNPPSLSIRAEGKVNSTGWTEPELSEWIYITPPADGILDLDFTAKKPSGFVHWTVTKICADRVIKDINIPGYWGKGKPLKGVRVHAATNKIEHKFGKSAKSGKFVLCGDDVPWPW